MPLTAPSSNPRVEEARGRRRCFASVWIVVVVLAVAAMGLTIGLVCRKSSGFCRPSSTVYPDELPQEASPFDVTDTTHLHRLDRLSDGLNFNGTSLTRTFYPNAPNETSCVEGFCIGSQGAIYSDWHNTCECFDNVECVTEYYFENSTFDELHNAFLYVRGLLPCEVTGDDV